MKSPGKTQISVTQGIFTQLKSILGVSIVLYPYTFSKLGYKFSIGLIIFMAFLSGYTLYFLVKSAKDTKSETLDELVSHAYGAFGSFIYSLILFLACLLPLIFYLNQSAEYINNTILRIMKKENEQTSLTIAFTMALLISLFYRKIENLRFVSLCGLFGLFSIFIYITYQFCSKYSEVKFSELKEAEISMDAIQSIGFIMFSFMSHTSIISIMEKVEKESSAIWIIFWSNLFAALFYSILGLCGYCVYPQTKNNYLLNPGIGSDLVVAFKIFLAIVNILSFPLMLIAARKNLAFIYSYVVDFHENWVTDSLGTFVNCFSAYIILMAGHSIKTIDNLFFIVGSFMMFILPVVMFIKIQKRKGIIDKLVCIICILLSIFGMYLGVSGFIELGSK